MQIAMHSMMIMYAMIERSQNMEYFGIRISMHTMRIKDEIAF